MSTNRRPLRLFSSTKDGDQMSDPLLSPQEVVADGVALKSHLQSEVVRAGDDPMIFQKSL
jgi:hypothetical protein